MKLRTECEYEIWSGFFGINANGDHPICGETIEMDVDDDYVEWDDEGNVSPSFTVTCPKCESNLEWPQMWEVIV